MVISVGCFAFISYLQLCRESWTKWLYVVRARNKIPVQTIDLFAFAMRDCRESEIRLFIVVLCCYQVSLPHSCRSACDPLMQSPFRINYKLFLFPRRSPILLRRITNSSSRGVDSVEAHKAAFSPPSSDMRFELSPVPPNPLGDGRSIKTAAALVIGCVVCRFI